MLATGWQVLSLGHVVGSVHASPPPLFERNGHDAPIGDSLSRPLQDVDELLSGHVQQHCVGQHRVVRGRLGCRSGP